MKNFLKMTQDNLSVNSQRVIIHPGYSSGMLSIKFKICVREKVSVSVQWIGMLG